MPAEEDWAPSGIQVEAAHAATNFEELLEADRGGEQQRSYIETEHGP